MSSVRITQLAELILEKTNSINSYLEEHKLPSPSLDPNAPPTLELSPEAKTYVEAALAAMDELSVLLLGPLGWLKLQVDHAYNMVSLHAMYRYGIPKLFPIGREASMQDLSVACGADEDSMTRILQHAVANHLLCQPRPGYVSHSACSGLLARSPPLMDWVGSACEDVWPAASQVIPALGKWRGPPLPSQTGFNLAENTPDPFFKALGGDLRRTTRFASAMSLMRSMPGFEPSAALDAYDWAALGSATVVDVGGSQGTFASALKRKFPALRVIVQDLPEVIETASSQSGTACLNVDMAGVVMQPHDFFSPQMQQDADVYFFRLTLHDWPDEFCSMILQQLIPALKPGARILVNDLIVPPAGSLPPYQDRQIRCQDLAMLALFNSKERSRGQWEKLITMTDSRFRIKSVFQMPDSPLGLIEVVWNC